MSFVTCKQFKDSQDAQDKALDTAKTEQAKALNNAKEQIAQSAMKAEAALLDCADNANGVTTSPTCLQNGKGGVISVAKIKQSIAGDVAVAVKPNSGITGNGTKNQPLGLNLSNDLTINTEGKLALNVVGPQVLANGNSLKTSNYKWGFHTFTGNVDNQTRQGVLGLPKDFSSQEKNLAMATTWDEYVNTQVYDFNGYYIASDRELNIWVANGDNTWYISNDHGVNPDGSLKNPNGWNTWQKLDNAGGVTNEMIKQMQNQINTLVGQDTTQNETINALKARVSALENELNKTCKVPCKHVSANYTVQDDDNTLICINTAPIIITLPDNIPQGRMFTIIQTTANKVTLVNGGNNRLVKPREGSLVLGGVDAAVTVLYEMGKVVRVFGDTESA
nr:MAG TPA: hypothetical protein [Caudoviricetes sp.]